MCVLKPGIFCVHGMEVHDEVRATSVKLREAAVLCCRLVDFMV